MGNAAVIQNSYTRTWAKPQKRFSSHALFKTKERAIFKHIPFKAVHCIYWAVLQSTTVCSIYVIIPDCQEKSQIVDIKSHRLLKSWQLAVDNKTWRKFLDRTSSVAHIYSKVTEIIINRLKFQQDVATFAISFCDYHAVCR